MNHSLNSFVEPMRAKEEIANLLGHKIRTLRVERNMTMEELALESGMDYSQLSRIERGKINTSVYQIYMISKVLNVPVYSVFKDLF
ncbi:MAG TPA: helix-turn-helix transcriptional regulator [Chitinophagaceae bacterium]|nr:helix-turn-helix transcriptional regulator [Chitinophagaceae bacterium]